MRKQELLDKVKQTVLNMEPSAKIILYGSRARGDIHSESDWDFLILLDGRVKYKRVERIRHNLYEIEWDSGEVLSSIIYSKTRWQGPLMKVTPFYQNITKEGFEI